MSGIMEHTFENHIQYLNRLCRICGERSFRNQSRSKHKNERHILCKPYQQQILVYFLIDIAKDKEGTHSNSICNKCIKRIYNLIKLATSERLDAAKACPLRGEKLWTGFIEELSIHQCQSCSHYLTQTNPVANRLLAQNKHRTSSSQESQQHFCSRLIFGQLKT